MIGKKWRTAPPKNCRPTVGQQSADSRTTVDRQSDDSRPTVDRQSTDSRPTVGRLSADCRSPPSTKIFCRQSADCWPFVGRLSADCWPHVGNLLAKCRLRTLVEYQKSLSSQGRTLHIDEKWNFLTWVRHIVLVFVGTNLLGLGFLGTKPLTIPSHHPRSQEAKNLFTAASCSFFFLLY